MRALVVGSGINGLFCARSLRQRGFETTVLDPRPLDHPDGSSSEGTRNINVWQSLKRAPLQRFGGSRWTEFERSTGSALLHRYDCVQLQPEDALAELLETNLGAGQEARILTEAEILRAYPALRSTRGPGLLLPGSCRAVGVEAAKKAVFDENVRTGVRFEKGETVEVRSGVVRTADGGTHEADVIVLAAGPWMGKLLAETGFSVKLKVTSQLYSVYSFDPAPTSLLVEDERGYEGHEFYSMPDIAFGGVKCALDEVGPEIAPGARREGEDDLQAVDGYIRALYKGDPKRVCWRHCWYTLAPDGEPIIGKHPELDGVLIAHACGGGGFKTAPAVGEILACLAANEEPPIAMEMFEPKRFAK